ncbi:hypothetical protein WK75_23170 [Burkholderia ubonensis]|nr:hypothetical protein WK75_23170 [Burkholderia ubonensis]
MTSSAPRATCTYTRRPAGTSNTAASPPSNSPAWMLASARIDTEPSRPSGDATSRSRPRFSSSPKRRSS